MKEILNEVHSLQNKLFDLERELDSKEEEIFAEAEKHGFKREKDSWTSVDVKSWRLEIIAHPNKSSSNLEFARHYIWDMCEDEGHWYDTSFPNKDSKVY